MEENDFSLKETCPKIGGGRSIPGGEMLTSSFDLVERMTFLYIRIVKARALPSNDLFVEVIIGSYKGRTKRSTNPNPNPEFHEVFAFNSDRLQGNVLEVAMKVNEEEAIGKCRFEVAEIPTRVPPDSPLAPQWYRLEDRNGNRFGGEVMLSVWMGTQADEVFPEAWHSDSSTVTGENVVITRSKVYLSPRLWYLRVNVIEAQDLVPLQGNRKNPEVLVKGFTGTMSPVWNEDMILEDKVGQKEECLGKCEIKLSQVERRVLPGPVPALWYNLERVGDSGFAGRIHLRVSLDGGYHVLDESIQYISDYRASAKLLWTPAIGVLELGVISSSGLMPMKSRDGRGTTDAYCVAKYGQKWLGRSEPPLGRDVVEYMLDFGSNIWSLRRGRANFERIVTFFTTFIDSWIWFDSVCKWKSPLSKADSALPDELDEEFDGFPSAKSLDLVKKSCLWSNLLSLHETADDFACVLRHETP
ncbi:C2 domain [Arabidopsis suecica]|uniref:C2 domain n=1 Tax=Arabidopsis suecica TaxID=45249 RepID=A0A8T1XZ37_ARASU|nr:C2 domain [Arabidopsis suecica]